MQLLLIIAIHARRSSGADGAHVAWDGATNPNPTPMVRANDGSLQVHVLKMSSAGLLMPNKKPIFPPPVRPNLQRPLLMPNYKLPLPSLLLNPPPSHPPAPQRLPVSPLPLPPLFPPPVRSSLQALGLPFPLVLAPLLPKRLPYPLSLHLLRQTRQKTSPLGSPLYLLPPLHLPVPKWLPVVALPKFLQLPLPPLLPGTSLLQTLQLLLLLRLVRACFVCNV